jgi:hypothetical protein
VAAKWDVAVKTISLVHVHWQEDNTFFAVV